jgi:hypothetical protein
MTLSRIATGAFRRPDDTFLQYDQLRSYAVHGEVAPVVTTEQASDFAWAVRDTLDQYLTVARENGFTRRSQLLDLLDTYPGRDVLIDWIRARGRGEWGKYLDSLTASQDPADQPAEPDGTRDSPDQA